MGVAGASCRNGGPLAPAPIESGKSQRSVNEFGGLSLL